MDNKAVEKALNDLLDALGIEELKRIQGEEPEEDEDKDMEDEDEEEEIDEKTKGMLTIVIGKKKG